MTVDLLTETPIPTANTLQVICSKHGLASVSFTYFSNTHFSSSSFAANLHWETATQECFTTGMGKTFFLALADAVERLAVARKPARTK